MDVTAQEKEKEELTLEEVALADAVAEEYIADLVRPTLPDGPTITRWLDIVYRLYDRDRPARVEIVESPCAALDLASSLTGQREICTDYCGVGDGGWVAFYDYFHRIGVLSKEDCADVLALRDFMRVAWDTVLLDECAIVIQRPTMLRLDDAGNLHSATGPCIEWVDGFKDYAWHGTWVPARFILAPRSHSKQEYLAITNTEQRRALSEAAGWTWVAEILVTTIVDSWTDPDTSLRYRLLRCEGGALLLSKQSPPLQDGSQPSYVEPVHEDLRTARAARKWQATDLTPSECEIDPDLSYGVET